MPVGYYELLAGVWDPMDGGPPPPPPPVQNAVTGASVQAGVATLIVANTRAVGDWISVTGVGAPFDTPQVQITARTSAQVSFFLSVADIPPSSATGTIAQTTAPNGPTPLSFSTSFVVKSGESVSQAIQRMKSGFGVGLKYVRLLDDGTGPASLATGVAAAHALGLGVICSFKNTPSAVANGTYDAAFRSLISSLSPNDYWSFYPEPDTDFYTAGSSATSYSFGSSGIIGGGFQNVIAASPFLDSNGKRPWILGADVAGMSRTVDGGRTWAPANKGNVGSHVSAVLWHPSTAGKCYAATDSFIAMSTDYGASWASRAGAVNFDGNGTYFVAPGGEHPRPTGNLLAMDGSTSTKYLWAGTATQGIKLSTDDANTWIATQLVGDHIRSIAMDPNNPDVLYVAVNNSGGGTAANSGIWKSTNARSSGMTFTKVSAFPSTQPEEMFFVNNQGVSQLYVVAGSDGAYQQIGTSWNPLGALPGTEVWESIAGYRDPTAGNIVLYVGCTNTASKQTVMKSVNGGTSWTSFSTGAGVSVGYTIYGTTKTWWAQVLPYLNFANNAAWTSAMLMVDPDNKNIVVTAGRGGTWVATISGSTVTWAPAVNGLAVTVCMSVSVDPRRPQRVATGNMDYTNFITDDHGASVLMGTPTGASSTGDVVRFDPNGTGTQSTLYVAASVRGTSTGSGEIWSCATPYATPFAYVNENIPVVNDVTAMGIGKDSLGNRVILAAITGNGLHRKVGGAWDAGSVSGPFASSSVGYIVFVPNSTVVYANDTTGVWRSNSAGAAGSWTKILAGGAAYGTLDSLALDPIDTARLYFAADGGVVKRINDASTVSGLSTNVTTISAVTNSGPIVCHPVSGALFILNRSNGQLMYSANPRAATPTFSNVADQFFMDDCKTIRSMAIGSDGFIYTADNGQGAMVGTPSASFTLAEYASAWTHLSGIQRGMRTDVRSVLITNEFSWRSTTTGRAMSDFYQAGIHDVLAFNVYSNAPTSLDTPGNIFPKLVSLASTRSVPWAISDIGSVTFSSVSGYADRSAWYGACADWILTNNNPPAQFASLNDLDSQYSVDTDTPSITAWKNFSVGILNGTQPPPPGSRFAGDPGVGKLYQGAAVTGGSVAKMAQLYTTPTASSIGVWRLYPGSQPSPGYSTTAWNNAKTRGAIPFVTLAVDKWVSGGYPSIASGTAATNAYLDQLALDIQTTLGTWPIWIVFMHEPDNPSNNLYGVNSAAYRAAKRYMYHYLRVVKGVANLAIMDSCYMMFTFNNTTTYPDGSDRDWRTFHCNWKGTTAPGSSKSNPNPIDFYTGAATAMDAQGLDVYNTVPSTYSTSAWNLFSTQSQKAITQINQAMNNNQLPYVVGETASYAWSSPPYNATTKIGVFDQAAHDKTQAWFDDSVNTALSKNIAALVYFSSVDNPNMLTTTTGTARPEDPNLWRAGFLHNESLFPTIVLPQ